MSSSKIFGIGLAKTGTTTLNEALRILGYSTIDFPLGLRGIDEHDAATDIPVADSFELLDRRYPGSKFIYTVRDRDEWLRSSKTHWARLIDGRGVPEEIGKLKHRLYGTLKFNADLFVEAYERHQKRVETYFVNRPNDLLTIDLCSGGSGWEPLCTFLKKEIPGCPFPHVNKTTDPFEYHLGPIIDRWMPAKAAKQIRRIKRKAIRVSSCLKSTS